MFLKSLGVLYLMATIFTVVCVLLLEHKTLKKEYELDKIEFARIVGKIIICIPFVPILMVKYFFDNEY